MSNNTVGVIFTGGTIACRMDEKSKKAEAVVQGAELLELIPGVHELGKISTEQYFNVSGHTLSLENIYDIVQRIRVMLSQEHIKGVVVTHGTATIEETGYMADLLVGSKKPVVFTGAMYNNSYWDTDGPRNLLNAIRIVLEPNSCEKGVMVCLNGQIHAARDVEKIHTNALSAFSSYEYGQIGYVDAERVVFYRQPLFRLTLPSNGVESNVDLIKLAAGMDDRFIRASLELEAKGIVVESLPGTGSVTLGFMKGLRQAVEKGIPVVITSRCHSGRVIPVYGGGCGSKDVADLGCFMAGDMSGVKVRILLSVALKSINNLEELKQIFEQISP